MTEEEKAAFIREYIEDAPKERQRVKCWDIATPKQTPISVQEQQQVTLEDKERIALQKYRSTFLSPPKIVDRKTVFLSDATREKIEEIVRRFGMRGASMSGFVENMAREHLKRYEKKLEQWKHL